jgi:hypothetical protein
MMSIEVYKNMTILLIIYPIVGPDPRTALTAKRSSSGAMVAQLNGS